MIRQIPANVRAEDLRHVHRLAQQLNPQQSDEIVEQFFDSLEKAKSERPAHLLERDAKLDPNWMKTPAYCAYVQYCGSEQAGKKSDFDGFRKMLPYLQEAGVGHVICLPIYESPGGDGGYDVSDYVPAQNLGGQPAYERFLAEADQRGLAVSTDLPANHTSEEHPWFQQALQGDREKMAYYLMVDDLEKIDEVREPHGGLTSVYREGDGSISRRAVVFPDVDQVHYREDVIGGETHKFYREFYPFQPSLDLQNPQVLGEIFDLLGKEANEGVLGKRTDAIPHWIKKPGTEAYGLPETHACHALVKTFYSMVAPHSLIMPEAVTSMDKAAEYAGHALTIEGRPTTSEGNFVLNFDLQAAIRETTYLKDSTALWERLENMAQLPAGAVWATPLEHHDETYISKRAPEMREHIASHNGVIYKNGNSAGARYFEALDHNPQLQANAILVSYLCPGVPIMYYGTEICASNQPEHALQRQHEQCEIFQNLGLNLPESACYDPRELQRGTITRQEFEEGKQLPSYQVWKELNHLWTDHGSLREGHLTPLSRKAEVVAGLKQAPGHPPLVGLVNLTDQPQSFEISLEEHPQLKGQTWEPLLASRSSLHWGKDSLRVELAPADRILLGHKDASSRDEAASE